MIQEELRRCQNCDSDFKINLEDFSFYERIKVPPPSWCPDCRFLRKAVFRNDIFVYKRPDSLSGEIIFSTFSKDSPVKVTGVKSWFSDKWNPLDYGRNYDWNRPFFEQFKELVGEVLWPSLSVEGSVRSDWCNNVSYIKDCYLVFGSGYAEDSFYSFGLAGSKNIFNSMDLIDCEISHEGFYNKKCYNSLFSLKCESSSDIVFCKDCIGCSNCFGCIGLRNKKYHIWNIPYSKEEYERFIKETDIGSFDNFLKTKEKVERFWLSSPVKFMSGRNNQNVSGDYISNSKNVTHSFHIQNGENLKYCDFLFWGNSKDSYDFFRFSNNSELIYESLVCGTNISNLRFCYECYPECGFLTYCMQCRSSSNLFGCIGLRNKEYCILNKQYTKEEYEKLVPKIIEHMNNMPHTDQKGRTYKYGEFFPPDFSPFAYNETIAQEYFPLTKEEALEKGYRWKDSESRDIKPDIKSQELPDHIKDVKEDIIGKVIECQHQGTCNHQCTEAFKIIPQELTFYKKMNLPLPRLCPNCRHYERLSQRNPLRLWKRQCQCHGINSENGTYQNITEHFHGERNCPNDFQTSYSSDRKEIVYCEQCYNSEVV